MVENGAKHSAFSYDKDADLFAADDDGKPGKVMGTLSNALMTSRYGTPNWISFTDSGEKIVLGASGGTWSSGSYDRIFMNGVALKV